MIRVSVTKDGPAGTQPREVASIEMRRTDGGYTAEFYGSKRTRRKPYVFKTVRVPLEQRAAFSDETADALDLLFHALAGLGGPRTMRRDDGGASHHDPAPR